MYAYPGYPPAALFSALFSTAPRAYNIHRSLDHGRGHGYTDLPATTLLARACWASVQARHDVRVARSSVRRATACVVPLAASVCTATVRVTRTSAAAFLAARAVGRHLRALFLHRTIAPIWAAEIAAHASQRRARAAVEALR